MKSRLLFCLILLLFVFTRFFNISKIPPSVYWDEASITYNAFSIVQTGYDEWGDFLPLHFRAFGEFKLPVFIYATVPFVKIFGLNEFSTRVPAALFSLGVIVITFLLTKKLTKSVEVGLLSIFFIVISPWFFIISRTGYEATAGLMFYLLGVYALLSTANKWMILLSTICFILTIYSYNSYRIISPLTVLLLMLFQKDHLKQVLNTNLPAVIGSLVFVVLSFIPIYRLYKYDAGINRLQAVESSFSEFIPNYLSHFNPSFLFIDGDKNLRSQQNNFGQLPVLMIFFIPIGMFYLYKRKELRFLIALILLAPIPAALTKESPHALRSLSLIPFVSIISAFGIVEIKKYFPKKFFIEPVIIIVSLLLFSYYFLSFINLYPKLSSRDWQYGYKSIFTNFKNEFSNYDQVIISDQYAQPYIFGLYYLKYDPIVFRKEVVRASVDNWGFSTVAKFNNFIFTKIRINNLPAGKSLIFATQNDKLNELTHKQVISNLDGSTAFYVYEYKK